MRVVAYIPIKLNNERLPYKNIKPLGKDKPLINCILDTAISPTNVDEISVYCSSDEIINYLPNGVVFLKRSDRLDLSTTSITRCNEVLRGECTCGYLCIVACDCAVPQEIKY